MAAKRFFLIIIAVFSFLLLLGAFSQGECQVTGWRFLREKDNLNLQLKMVGCYLENGEAQRAEEKLVMVKDSVGEDDLFSKEQIRVYEARLRTVDPQKRKKEILFWKKTIVNNPSYPDAWISLGLLWQQEGEEQKFKLAIEKACQLGRGREDIQLAAENLDFSCP